MERERKGGEERDLHHLLVASIIRNPKFHRNLRKIYFREHSSHIKSSSNCIHNAIMFLNESLF